MPIGPLKNLFGSQKDAFFLEIGDAEGTGDSTPAAPAPQAPAVVAEPAAPVAAAPEAPAPAPKSTKTSIKAAKAAAPAAPAKSPEPPKPAPAPVTLPPETAFASKFVPSNTPRRRPGPSLNGFKDMARDMGRR